MSVRSYATGPDGAGTPQAVGGHVLMSAASAVQQPTQLHAVPAGAVGVGGSKTLAPAPAPRPAAQALVTGERHGSTSAAALQSQSARLPTLQAASIPNLPTTATSNMPYAHTGRETPEQLLPAHLSARRGDNQPSQTEMGTGSEIQRTESASSRRRSAKRAQLARRASKEHEAVIQNAPRDEHSSQPESTRRVYGADTASGNQAAAAQPDLGGRRPSYADAVRLGTTSRSHSGSEGEGEEEPRIMDNRNLRGNRSSRNLASHASFSHISGQSSPVMPPSGSMATAHYASTQSLAYSTDSLPPATIGGEYSGTGEASEGPTSAMSRGHLGAPPVVVLAGDQDNISGDSYEDVSPVTARPSVSSAAQPLSSVVGPHTSSAPPKTTMSGPPRASQRPGDVVEDLEAESM
jgi:hypothetical protein